MFKKKVLFVSSLVLVALVSPALASESISLPPLDLGSLVTWLVGIGGTMITIAGTMFGIRKGSKFLGG